MEIVKAAQELFRQGDIHTVTIEQIADAADIGKGTVYKHFKSKDEIFARILIDQNRAMRAAIANIEPTTGFKTRLDRIIETIWEYDMQDASLLHRINQHLGSGLLTRNLGPEMLKEFGDMQEEDTAFYEALLSDAQQRGEVVNAPLEALLFCATAAIDGAIVHFWQLESLGVVTKEQQAGYLEQLKKFVYRALKAN